MSNPKSPVDAGEAQRDRSAIGMSLRTLELLQAQAEAARTEVASLRREVVKTREELNRVRSAQLHAANEDLILAAEHAETVAQTAISSLDELSRYSQLDELTGAPNRTLLLDRLHTAIALAQRQATHVGLLFVDLDRFKQINDTLGHAVGDAVLQLVTQRLQAAVRDSDTVSRHGGDEFLVLLTQISSRSDAASVAEKMLAILAKPARIGEHTLQLSASVGIAVFPEDGADPTSLIERADAAMYRSKRRGAGAFEVHTGAGSADAEPAAARVHAPRFARSDFARAEHEARLRELSSANHELLRAAQVAQQLKVHAEEAHQRQIHFVAKAAHAMRTPLSVIKSTTSRLRQPGAEAAVSPRHQEVLHRQVAHLARLIDDLLDGSMVGGGEFKLDRSVAHLDAIVSAAVDTCRHTLDARSQSLHLRLATPEALLEADSLRLTQVFSNLLIDASRRAPEQGSVWVSTEVVGSEAVVTFRNDGNGIASETLPHIFDLFVLEDHVPSDDPGLGIGLAVVKELAKAHGGDVHAGDIPGDRGSWFTVRLPLHAPTAG